MLEAMLGLPILQISLWETIIPFLSKEYNISPYIQDRREL
jgi:hypothetical protein